MIDYPMSTANSANRHYRWLTTNKLTTDNCSL